MTRTTISSLLNDAVDDWRKTVLPSEPTGCTRPNVEATVDALLKKYIPVVADELARMVVLNTDSHKVRSYLKDLHINPNGWRNLGDMRAILDLRTTYRKCMNERTKM